MKDLRNLGPFDYLRILWRRKWYALAGLVLVSGGAAIYSWRMVDIYKSESTVLVESAVIPQDYVRPSERSSPEEQIAAIRSQLQSRRFLEQMIQEFQLYDYGTGKDFSMDNAVASLRNNIQVTSVSRNTFSISCSATVPQVAQNLTGRVVQALIQSGNSSRKNKAVETDQFLDQQLRQTEQKLSDQEEKIKQFKIAHLGELPEQSSANMNALSGLNAQLASVENALQNARDRQKMLDLRAQEQNRLNVLGSSILSSPDLLSSPDSHETKNTPPANPLLKAKQEELNALRLKYTPNHPDVIRLSREVEQLKRQEAEMAAASESSEATPLGATQEKPASTEPEKSELMTGAIMEAESAQIKMETDAIKSEIANRQKEREAILSQIRTYQNRLDKAPALEQEFMALSREHDALRQQYASLKSKKFQAQMTANLETDSNSDSYKVIDDANLPEKAAFPDRMHIILMGLAAGLLVGIGAAFGRELLDTTLNGEDEVASVLKLPVLATIAERPARPPRKLIGHPEIQKSA
jgi:succinoglycan biosynthesis transport protein ExoP